MFCPDYGGECRGEDCRDWDKAASICSRLAMQQEQKKLTGFMEVFAESERINTLRTQASLQALLNLPMLPPESKKFIAKMLEAPSSEVAKNLLNEVNL